MPDSVLERIAEELKTALATITEANDYPVTLSVSRATVRDIPKHLDLILHQGDGTRNDDAPTGLESWRQTFFAVAYVLPPDGDATPIDEYNNAIAASIYNALSEDTSRGGLAIDTVFEQVFPFPPIEGEFGGLTFVFSVEYRHSLGDANESVSD